MKLLLLIPLLLMPFSASAEPISAIAAIAAMYAGATAATGVVAGMLFIGGAMSLAGNASGNKKLQMWGNVVSLAGGVGAFSQAGSSAAASTAAGETAAGGAGAEALSQTAAPAAEGAAAGELASSAPAYGGVGTPGAGAASDTVSGVSSGVTSAGTTVSAPAASESSLLDKLSAGIKNNKELVDIGGGIVKGAMSGYQQQQGRFDQNAYLDQLRSNFNDSVTGIDPQGQFINPNADPTAGRQLQNPIRYTPAPRTAGLVKRAQGG